MRSLSSAFSAIATWCRSWMISSRRYRVALRATCRYRRASRRAGLLSAEMRSENDRLQTELGERDQQIKMLVGENEVLKSQVEHLTVWQGRELARAEAETAMQLARKVRALENQQSLNEDDLP